MYIIPKYLYLIVIILLFGACQNKDQDKIDQITQALQEDLDLANINITNAVEVFEEDPMMALGTDNIESNDTSLLAQEQDNLEKTDIIQQIDRNDIENAETFEKMPVETIEIAQEKVPYEVAARTDTKPVYQQRNISEQTRAKSSQYLNTVQQDSYIKIGLDKPNVVVGRGHTQKITTVVFAKNRAVMVDVYLFAVPTYSHLVRNYNTLIGYAKNLELINGQSQFTRYWNGRRANGSYLRPGTYNVYVEYQYKNAQGQIIYKMGRYWGGNHRRWKAIIS